MDYKRVMSGKGPSQRERAEGVQAIKDASEWVLPASPAEAGAMVALGPFAKAVKLGGLAAATAGYSPDTEAAGGGIVKGALTGLRELFHGGRKFDKWNPATIGTGEGMGVQGPGLYAGDKQALAKVYMKYGGDDPAVTKLLVDDSSIIETAKKMSPEHRAAYDEAVAKLVELGLPADKYGIKMALNSGRYYDNERVRKALTNSGVKGFKQDLYNDFGNEFVIFDPDIIKAYETLDIPGYAKGGKVEAPIWEALRGMGFSEQAVKDRKLEHELEREKGYMPKGMTNAEFDPGMYLTAPDKIVPYYPDWLSTQGHDTGGYHSPVEGIVVPDRHPGYPIGEVLAHEGIHRKALQLPPEEILGEGRQAAQRGALNNLLRYIEGKRLLPNGITGREMVDELAPELMGHETYLPAGQRLTKSELGKAVLQTPEEKLWWLSRRYPRQEGIDAITGASPE